MYSTAPTKDATQYWEDMTQIRLEYFPDPGPGWNGGTHQGHALYEGQLIQIEGVADPRRSTRDQSSAHHAGRQLGLEHSHCRFPRAGGSANSIFVGGQISADANKENRFMLAISAAQTHNIFRFIGNVLE